MLVRQVSLVPRARRTSTTASHSTAAARAPVSMTSTMHSVSATSAEADSPARNVGYLLFIMYMYKKKKATTA